MILLIDNYDSFSYNLVQMAGSINPDIKVIRNDAMTVEEIRALAPSHIILSRDLVIRKMPVSAKRLCGIFREKSRSSACVSDIRASAKYTAAPFLMQNS